MNPICEVIPCCCVRDIATSPGVRVRAPLGGCHYSVYQTPKVRFGCVWLHLCISGTAFKKQNLGQKSSCVDIGRQKHPVSRPEYTQKVATNPGQQKEPISLCVPRPPRLRAQGDLCRCAAATQFRRRIWRVVPGMCQCSLPVPAVLSWWTCVRLSEMAAGQGFLHRNLVWATGAVVPSVVRNTRF